MNDSLDLTQNISNAMIKHCIKCKDCQKWRKCKDGANEWREIYKPCKKLSSYCIVKCAIKYTKIVYVFLNTKSKRKILYFSKI